MAIVQIVHDYMITSSNGNSFRATGHLCGEFIGHRWNPRTKASDAELWCFFICVRMNGWVNNRETGNLRRHRAHYDVTAMITKMRTFMILFTGKTCKNAKYGVNSSGNLECLRFIYLVLQICVYKLFLSSGFNDMLNICSPDASHEKYHGWQSYMLNGVRWTVWNKCELVASSCSAGVCLPILGYIIAHKNI